MLDYTKTGERQRQRSQLEGLGGDFVDPLRSPRLSPREVEIVELASIGLTNREIGERLGLAEASVKGVLARLMRRFDCANRLQLVTLIQRRRIDDST